MKKKLLTSIFSVIAICASALTAVACKGNENESKCEHNYGEGVITVEATCEEDGVKLYTCSECNEEYTEAIPAFGHTEERMEGVAATCTHEGRTDGVKCSNCDKVIVEPQVLEKLGHKPVEDKAVAATCTEDGLTAGSHCERCDVVLEAQEIIPAHGHNEIVKQEAVGATCTEEGKTKGTACSVCGEDIQVSFTIPALGHNVVEDEAIAATCTENGLTAGSHCTRCDVVLNAQEIIPALGHNEQITDAVEPTCTEFGTEERRECLTCGQIVGGENIPALGHDTVLHEGQAATCTEIGWEDYESCKRCDYTTYQELPALGHTAEVVKGYAATCTEEGKTDGEKCAVCNEVLTVQKTILVLGHNDENNDNVCERCDEKLTATAGMMLMTVEKGESMAGNWYRIYRAESGYDVGSLYTTNGFGLLANSVSYGYYDAYLFHSGPLATLDGLEVVYTDEYIDVHFVCGTYTIIRNGIVTSETVTFDENVKVSSAAQNVFRLVDEKHCDSNGLAHDLKVVEGYAPTCTETGVTDIEKCSNCGASSTRPKTIPTVAHTEVSVNKVDATCLSYGTTARRECSICGTVLEESEIIVPTGHTDNNSDDACDICGMKVEGVDAVTDHSDFVEVAVAKGDFVAGKWYRIYRDESTPGCYIDLSTDKNNGYLVAYRSNSSYENATYFYSGPLYIIKGIKIVYTDEYIDFYLEEGVYEIMHYTTGASTGLKLTIDETTTITGFTSGKCFELK